jgi:hypothetical protein
MVDPIGVLVLEIRAGLAADGGSWPVVVRGGRRFEGDEEDPGDLPPLVIVRSNNRTRTPRAAHARWRVVVQSYDVDPRLAAALDERVSEIIHNVGPRHTPGRVALYRSQEDVGGQPGEDPDTRWSSMTSIFIAHATTATNV